jgi:hypothetical protein
MSRSQVPCGPTWGSKFAAMRKELELGARSRLPALERGERGVLEVPGKTRKSGQALFTHTGLQEPHKVVRTHSGSFWCWDSHGWTRTHLHAPHPDLGVSQHLTPLWWGSQHLPPWGSQPLPPYSILCSSRPSLHPNGHFVSGVPKSRPAGLPGLWSLITFGGGLRSSCRLKQSCRSRRDLSNGMSHVLCTRVFRVDSRLLVVGSQNRRTPGSSTPGPSCGHNLHFRCPNEQCEPI